MGACSCMGVYKFPKLFYYQLVGQTVDVVCLYFLATKLSRQIFFS